MKQTPKEIYDKYNNQSADKVRWLDKKTRNKMIKCYITAFADLIRHGVWAPHLYEEVRKYKAVVIATDKSFRTAESYEHAEGEKVYRNAEVTEMRCVYCGKMYRMWEAER